MNNSVVFEEPTDRTDVLRTRESELVNIIEAIKGLEGNIDWSTLKSKVFDGVSESLERRLHQELLKSELNPPEIYKLQGQIAWAKKYSKLDTLATVYRAELTNVRSQLNPPTERDIAP